MVVEDEAVKLGHLMYSPLVQTQRLLLFLIAVSSVCCVGIASVALQGMKACVLKV